MNTGQYIERSSAWMPSGPESGVAISSRVRLARNMADAAFPGWAGEEDRIRVWEQLRDLLPACPSIKNYQAAGMDELSGLDKQILFERHLISRELAERSRGSGVVIRDDEVVAVMINEEDHIRLQCIRPGLDIAAAWKEADALDSEIEGSVDFSFSPQLGYLTACPSNVGTGMRASVMLHVPGLVLTKEINAVVKGMAKIGLAVRGLWGEGSEAAGNMFQVSNQMTLGESEEDIVDQLEQIVQEIIEHERNARWRVLEADEHRIYDLPGRSYGILAYAHILRSKEALDLLSDLRLGVDMGIVDLRNECVINELLILSQPGHLQKQEGRKLKATERDIRRAELIRERIKASKNDLDGKEHE